MNNFYFSITIFVVLTACTRATTSTVSPTQTNTNSIVVDGRTRTYTVHVPIKITTPTSLVIVLHGGGGNDDNAERMTGMSAKADKEGFVVVYPNGSGRLDDKLLTWNSGNCCGYALDEKIDDTKFISALIDQMIATHKIDPKRVYVTGISNGGMMSYKLACDLANKIAAIAPVAGALNVECKPSQPVSVIAFHGTNDQHVLYEGGKPKTQADTHERVDQSVEFAISFWVKQDGCNATPQKTEKGNIVSEIYSGCKSNTGVALYAIKGGGHAWPGGVGGTFIADTPTQEISATDVMWEFFVKHPKQ
ncbi:MAG: dienelactone hydrolase family protein [Chloroflexi bacterium]|nr:dienelactone hydrolase family protein [Chloroflexota bacterium]